MRKMTIAEMRRREVLILATYRNGVENSIEPTTEDIDRAATLMNSFYRLCGLAERNLYLANDPRTEGKRSTKASEEREYNWFIRLKNDFSFYGLTLCYCGYKPSIGTNAAHGGFCEKINRYFYE